MGNDFYHFTIFGCVCVHSSDLHAVVEDSLPVILKVGSEEIGSSPCKCSPLLSLTFVEIKKSYT